MRTTYYAIRNRASGLLFPQFGPTSGMRTTSYEFPLDMSEKFPPRLFSEFRHAKRYIAMYCKGKDLGFSEGGYGKSFLPRPNRHAVDFEIISITLEIH